jgi:hypothetical protein
MTPQLRALVRARAGDRCEYCHLPQAALAFAPFHVEHIIVRQHDGETDEDNLALSCDRCNAYKGPNLTAIDPQSKTLWPLFNPRQQKWDEHFALAGAEVRGLTPVGRATVNLFHMNAARRVALRRTLG